jgi:aryl-alcohol dehydrogenase-like predicted oxidoreductase
MDYRQLGRSGLKVSTIGLGSWLTYGRSVDDDSAHDCLSAALERGVNFFDTADVYANGEAEKTLGAWLAGVPRGDVVVATKTYFQMGPGPNDRGLSRKHIMESCHASLRRLGLDYVDLYQCHRYDAETPLDETLRALDDLVARGDVLYAGISEWTAGQIDEAVRRQQAAGLRPIISNQPQYSLLARRIETDVLPTCRANGIGQVVFSPLAGGILTGKYRPGEPPPAGTRSAHPQDSQFTARAFRTDVLEAVERLSREVAEPLGIPVTQLSLAWILRQDGITSAIVGARSVEQVAQNIPAADVELDTETIARVEAIMEPFQTMLQPA